MIMPHDNARISDVFGWIFLQPDLNNNGCRLRKNYIEAKEIRWIYLHNGMNIGSMLLSPIVGMIRIVLSIYKLVTENEWNMSPFEFGTRRYLWGQIGRGAFELIGGGYLLWVVDLIVTIGRCWNKYHSSVPS